MSGTNAIARNALWNWAGMSTHMLVGFIVAPFLVRHLGQSTYGLWIVIGSLTSYFAVLDLGVGGSVGRNIAFHRARNDISAVNGILSTAIAYLCGVAVLCLFATAGALLLVFNIFDVPTDQSADVRIALMLVGVNLALTLPLNALDGVLWAYQRFDLQNWVDIPMVLLRAVLTFWLIDSRYDLVTLAILTISTSLFAACVKGVLAMRQQAGLRLRPSFVSREAARSLFGYGVWYFLLSLVRSIGPQVSLTVIGSRLGTALVTPFSVATRLTSYANQFLIAGTQVITPVATSFHARSEQDRERSLFLEGGKWCLVMGLFFLSLFAFLGGPFIGVWMGPDLEWAYSLLLILALGELVPMSQWITYSMILGKGRHRILAGLGLVEVTAGGVLVALFATQYGLLGVCVLIAVPACVCRGAGQLVFGCRMVGVPVPTYLAQAMLPAVVVATGPALALGVLTHFWTPTGWVGMFLCGGLYAAGFFAVAATRLLGLDGMRRLARYVIGPQRTDAPPLGASPDSKLRTSI